MKRGVDMFMSNPFAVDEFFEQPFLVHYLWITMLLMVISGSNMWIMDVSRGTDMPTF